MDNAKKDPSSDKLEKKDQPITFEIPVQGSLGILALGAVGIKAWREKRKEFLSQKLKK